MPAEVLSNLIKYIGSTAIIKTEPGVASSSELKCKIEPIDLTKSPPKGNINKDPSNITTNNKFTLVTSRFDSYQANRKLIESRKHGPLRNLIGKGALKIASKAPVPLPLSGNIIKETIDTRPVSVIVGPYMGANKEYKNLGMCNIINNEIKLLNKVV